MHGAKQGPCTYVATYRALDDKAQTMALQRAKPSALRREPPPPLKFRSKQPRSPTTSCSVPSRASLRRSLYCTEFRAPQLSRQQRYLTHGSQTSNYPVVFAFFDLDLVTKSPMRRPRTCIRLCRVLVSDIAPLQPPSAAGWNWCGTPRQLVSFLLPVVLVPSIPLPREKCSSKYPDAVHLIRSAWLAVLVPREIHQSIAETECALSETCMR